MAKLEILEFPDPRLRTKAKPVTIFDENLHKLTQDMLETMYDAPGVGLAAPQIGVPLRVMIFGVDENPRDPDAGSVPSTVVINPTWEVVDEDEDNVRTFSGMGQSR